MKQKNKGILLLAIGIIMLVVALLLFCFVESRWTAICFLASIILNAAGLFILTSPKKNTSTK